MADYYDKAKVEFAKLEKTSDKLKADWGRIETNAKHHKDMVIQAADQISREVQDAKDGGMTGTKIGDFMKDPGVAKMVKYVEDIEKKTDALEKEWVKTAAAAKVLKDAASKLVNEADKEIKERKNPSKLKKLVGAESKSLPLIEKMREGANEIFLDMRDGIVQDSTSGFLISKGLFDRLIATAVKETKEGRKEADAKSQAMQGFDMRVLGSKTGKAKKAHEAITACCTKAATALRDSKIDDAKAQIKTAKDLLKIMLETDKFYKDAIGRKNKYDIEAMKQSKDGKIILKTLEALSKSTEEAARLVVQANAKVNSAK